MYGSFELDAYAGSRAFALTARSDIIGFFSERVLQEFRFVAQGRLELEMVAVFVAIHVWQSLVYWTSQLSIFFDNESMRSSVIKGYIKNHLVDCLTGGFYRIEEEVGCQVWLERMPSQPNPADEPTRGECSDLLGSRERGYALMSGKNGSMQPEAQGVTARSKIDRNHQKKKKHRLTELRAILSK